MLILCRLGIHRYRWLFVGSDWQPNDYVRACVRCGREPMAALRLDEAS